MVEIAYIFPGQGAQYVGMGRELYRGFEVAKETFESANQTLGFDLARLCFEGPAQELKRTLNNQLAVLTTSIACLRSLEAETRKFSPKATAGLSLGEYSALVCAGSIRFEDALRVVKKRAQFMEEASCQNPGVMAAVLGLSEGGVSQICQSTGVQIANLNCPGQVVISGVREGVEKATGLAKAKGAKRIVLLDVSGPFHCSLMDGAAEKLRDELNNFKISKPLMPFVTNVSADYEEDPAKIKRNLADQVNHSTLWARSIKKITSTGIKTFIEIGPGRVLKGLLRRIDPSLEVYSVEDKSTLERALNVVEG